MMALSVDGQHVVVGGNGPVQVYSVTNGAEVSLPTLDVPNYSALALSPDGKTLALSGMGSNEFIEVIQFWNIQTGRLVSTLKTEIGLYIYCLAFSPDGKTLAVGGMSPDDTSYLTLLDVSTQKTVQTINASGMSVGSVCFSRDGSLLADSYGNYSEFTAEIWNLKSGKQTFNSKTELGYGYSAIALSPDGSSLAVAANTTTGPLMNTWSIATGKVLESFPTSVGTGGNAGIRSLAYSPDGKILADCGYGNGALLETWNPKTAAKLGSTDALGESELYVLSFSPDGKTLIDIVNGATNLQGANTSRVEAFNSTTLKPEKSFLTSPLSVTSDLVYSPNGNRVVGSAVETSNGATYPVVAVWNLETGNLVTTLKTSATQGVTSVAFAPDGTTIVVGGVSLESKGVLELWNISTQVRTKSLSPAASATVASVAFLPGSANFIAAGQDTQGLPVYEEWNLVSGKSSGAITLNKSGTISSVAVSPNGMTMVIGYSGNNSGTVQAWDLTTLQTNAWVPTASTLGVYSVGFSPDGKSFASSGHTNIYEGRETGYIPFAYMEVWGATSGSLLSAVSIGDSGTNRATVSYSPDGLDLLFGLYGGINAFSTISDSPVWEDLIGVPIAIAVSPSSKQIICSFSNGMVVAGTNPTYRVPVLTALNLSSQTVQYGGSVKATVVISSPAPSSGYAVAISNEFNNVAFPASVVIPSGHTSVTFTVSADIWNTIGTAYLNAQAIDGGYATGTLTILLPSVTSTVLSPTAVTGGNSTTATITLNQVAPKGGIPVVVTTTAPLTYGPTTVFVPEGKSSVSVSIPTPVVTSSTMATIVASVAGTSKTATLTIH
jgi:WD40 repeat protein